MSNICSVNFLSYKIIFLAPLLHLGSDGFHVEVVFGAVHHLLHDAAGRRFRTKFRRVEALYVVAVVAHKRLEGVYELQRRPQLQSGSDHKVIENLAFAQHDVKIRAVGQEISLGSSPASSTESRF